MGTKGRIQLFREGLSNKNMKTYWYYGKQNFGAAWLSFTVRLNKKEWEIMNTRASAVSFYSLKHL